MALILEVLDAHTGEVRDRHRLGTEPLAIGRGYDNDVILDDPYVDATHARVGVDGAGIAVIEDLGSVNGLVAPDGTRASRLTVYPGTALRVGRTYLRLQDSATPLPPALPDAHPPNRRWSPAWLGAWWGQLGLTAAVAGVLGWWAWLGTWTKHGASEAVAGLLSLLVLLAIWAGIWSIASRMVTHRFRFLAHLAVAAAGLLGAAVLEALGEWGGFLFPDHILGRPLWIAVWFVALAALVAAHLTLASSLTPRRRWLAGAVTGAVLFAGGLAIWLVNKDNFTAVPEFNGMVKPAPTVLLPTHEAGEIEDVAAALKGRVDALAARMAASAGG